MAATAAPGRIADARGPAGGAGPRFFIPSLDGIRALAILLVFLCHAGWDRLHGTFGVTIFFFLSGYLITTLLRREAERTGRVDLASFYARRSLRILPPFYLVLLITTLLMLAARPAAVHGGAVGSMILQVANYRQILFGDTALGLGMGVAWSLAVEEHFYLIFPLAYLAMARRLSRRGQAATLLGFCGLILAWRCVLVHGCRAPEWRIYLGTDTRADSILFGCALAVLGNPVLDPAGPTRRRVELILAPLAVLMILASFQLRPGDPLANTVGYTMQNLALVPLFCVAIRHHDRPFLRILNWRTTRTLGLLSYSLYLVHLKVLKVFTAAGIGKIPRTLGALLISLALSCVIYLVVERPCARLKDRMVRAIRSRGQAPAGRPELAFPGGQWATS